MSLDAGHGTPPAQQSLADLGLLGVHHAPAALALAGAAIVLQPEGGGWPAPHTLAEWLAVVGGFSFALNNVMLRREAHRPEAARALAMFLGGALVAGAVAATLALRGQVPGLPPPAWAWLAGSLALAVAFLGGNLALQYGAARLPANVTAVIMVSEVLFASVSAALLGAGTLTPPLLLGGAAEAPLQPRQSGLAPAADTAPAAGPAGGARGVGGGGLSPWRSSSRSSSAACSGLPR